MEFIITHDGSNWILENDCIRLSAATLADLDMALEKLVREKGMLRKGQTEKVFMAFDNSTIPQWIRQYSQHYFNRMISITG